MNKTLIALAGLLLPATLHAQFSQPMRDVENPAQNVRAMQGTFGQGAFVQNAFVYAPAPPAMKRLTIETLSLRCDVADNVTTVHATVTLLVRNSPSESPIPVRVPILMVRQGQTAANLNRNIWVGTINGRLYHDNVGNTDGPNVTAWRLPSNEPFTCEYSIMGGLTNLPQ